jgi:hypothetical protein
MAANSLSWPWASSLVRLGPGGRATDLSTSDHNAHAYPNSAVCWKEATTVCSRRAGIEPFQEDDPEWLDPRNVWWTPGRGPGEDSQLLNGTYDVDPEQRTTTAGMLGLNNRCEALLWRRAPLGRLGVKAAVMPPGTAAPASLPLDARSFEEHRRTRRRRLSGRKLAPGS